MQFCSLDCCFTFEHCDGWPSHDDWLSLKQLGYQKYDQKHKGEDFCYWKTFRDEKGNRAYQIGVLFYDFRKFANQSKDANRIGTMYQCMLICKERIDMDVSKEIDITEFEAMAKTFYKAMNKWA